MDRKIGLPPDLIMRPAVDFHAMADYWHVDERIKALHAMGLDGRGVKVAICDTMGKVNHNGLPTPIFAANMTTDRDGTDGHGHGHHCAGIALGRHGGGIAPAAELLAIKVLNSEGSGASSWINKGRELAATEGADVISESLGGPGWYQEDIDSINRCYRTGTALVIAAAGNSGYRGTKNTIGVPGKYPQTWCEGAHDKFGKIATFSSGGREIDSASPGVQILSTLPGNRFAAWDGTSMATPVRAGFQALVIQKRRALGLVEIIGAHAWRDWYDKGEFYIDGGSPGVDVRFGRGMMAYDKIIDWLLDREPEYV